MKQLFLSLMFCMGFLSPLSCGTRSLAGDYVELTPDQKARQALDEQNFAGAVELYRSLIEAEPEAYERYPFLATAYAGLSGFDVFQTLVDVALSSADSSTVNQSLAAAVPADPSETDLTAMKAAIQILLDMPPDHRTSSNPAIYYASSAAIQLQFYQAAYPLMLMNKFTGTASSGSVDPERLATMTEEEALDILTSLQAVQASGGVVGDAVAGVLATIESQPGGNNREKLSNYLATRPS